MSASGRTLVLLRHGESTWNRENRFTGWTDVPLTEGGLAEARRAGERLLREQIIPVTAHASMLQRAIQTLREVLVQLDLPSLPTQYAWQLNERHYGALQGLDKNETIEKYGAEQTLGWRRGFAERPPLVEPDDPRNPRLDERYASVPGELLPRGESLKDTLARVIPYWEESIAPSLASGTVLVVAHGNSLRALVMHLENLGPEAIRTRNIPTGIPLVYELDADSRPLAQRFLAEEDELDAGLARAQHRP